MLSLANRSIRWQVLTAILVSTIALAGVSGFEVLERWRVARENGRLEQLVVTVTSISSLVHELQKERGASALFIASKGEQFSKELAAQRQETDRSLAGLQQALGVIRDREEFGSFMARLRDSENSLVRLQGQRKGISGLELSGRDSFVFFTSTISGMLDASWEIARLTRDGDLKGAVVGYLSLMLGKERAGQERATGSAGFATGRFDSELFQRLIGLGVAQETYLSVFRGAASAELVAALEQGPEGRAREEVEALRRIARDAGVGGDLKGTAAPVWFKLTTARIDQLKALEDKVAERLGEQAKQLAGTARAGFLTILAVALLCSAGSLLLGFVIIRSIARALGGLTRVTAAIAAGEATDSIPGTERGDEVGTLARSIQAIHQAGISATRIKTALDTVSANVMMADPNGDIIYVNGAVNAMFRRAEADIRRQLPGFSADGLLGTSIDRFHKDPKRIRALLAGLREPYRTQITVGVRKFALVATPVTNAQGESYGTAVEWHDITLELTIQEEVAGLVDAASRGDLSRRIPLEGKEGFMLRLAEGMNGLAATVSHSLEAIAGFLGHLAEGDLSQRIEGRFEGMFARIRDDANTSAERLGGIVGRISAASGDIGTASAEISAGSADLAERTEQQAAALEQTSATMEELAGTVRRNAESASEVQEVATSTQKAAESGGSIAGSAIEAMRRIEESSRKIIDIIGVIDEIAFQTNLLALNAAVEAARAGDAGKGFAVVAQEVRVLAQRSAQASKEIKSLILDSDRQVRDGVDLVGQAGKALSGIVGDVKRVANLIVDIARASREQTVSLDEVNKMVSQMDDVTQKNAALVEETSAAAQALAQEAGDLREMMAFFRIQSS